MIFGKIDFLNLLPFHVFIKRHIRSSHTKSIIRHKRNVPSYINNEFKNKRVDGAFISSIESRKSRCLDIGIVAKKEVQSVLVFEGTLQFDKASATSNKLSQILELQGEIVIGDRALKRYLNGEPCIDMAEVWNKKTGLPFVFARFCYNRHRKYFERLGKKFLHTEHKIPQYILKKESQKVGIAQKDILNYLEKISYDIDKKSKKGLNLFLSKADKISK